MGTQPYIGLELPGNGGQIYNLRVNSLVEVVAPRWNKANQPALPTWAQMQLMLRCKGETGGRIYLSLVLVPRFGPHTSQQPDHTF